MAFLNDEDRSALDERLTDGMKGPVKVVLYTEPKQAGPGRRACLTCIETEQLMGEVAELSDLLEFEVAEAGSSTAGADGISVTPTLAVYSEQDSGVRFLGLPAGYEFLSFLETVLSMSMGKPYGLSPESARVVELINDPLDLKIFSTPT